MKYFRQRILCVVLIFACLLFLFSCNKSKFGKAVSNLEKLDVVVHIATAEELKMSLERMKESGLGIQGTIVNGFHSKVPPGFFIQCFEMEYITDAEILYRDIKNNTEYNVVIDEEIVIYGDSFYVYRLI